ncbi:MAG: hypothetical protein EGP78_06060 [Alistipes shahii]|nr:hypothetical protein [Alistipes shahii]
MAGKIKIMLLKPAVRQDSTGELVGDPTPWRHFWATKTENGGRANLYASRIVHENSVVFSVPYNKGITPDMLVEIDGERRPIEAVYEEGFRKTTHILITKTDIDNNAGY